MIKYVIVKMVELKKYLQMEVSLYVVKQFLVSSHIDSMSHMLTYSTLNLTVSCSFDLYFCALFP